MVRLWAARAPLRPPCAVVEKPAQQQQVQLLLVDNEGQPKRRLAITHGVTNIHHLLKHLGAESGKVLKCVMMDGNVVECMTQVCDVQPGQGHHLGSRMARVE